MSLIFHLILNEICYIDIKFNIKSNIFYGKFVYNVSRYRDSYKN